MRRCAGWWDRVISVCDLLRPAHNKLVWGGVVLIWLCFSVCDWGFSKSHVSSWYPSWWRVTFPPFWSQTELKLHSQTKITDSFLKLTSCYKYSWNQAGLLRPAPSRCSGRVWTWCFWWFLLIGPIVPEQCCLTDMVESSHWQTWTFKEQVHKASGWVEIYEGTCTMGVISSQDPETWFQKSGKFSQWQSFISKIDVRWIVGTWCYHGYQECDLACQHILILTGPHRSAPPRQTTRVTVAAAAPSSCR